MSPDSLLWFVLAGLLLNLTPGPDVVYVVSSALRGGVRSGWVAALGISAGCLVHVGLAAWGLGAVLAASPKAFGLLRWAGAAYLVWMGVRLWMASFQSEKTIAEQPIANGDSELKSLNQVFLNGCWTNMLNPKVALFFLAFVPQFIGPGVTHKTGAFLALGTLFSVNGALVNMAWAWVAAWAARRVSLRRSAMAWLDRLSGTLFIGFGWRLGLADAPLTPVLSR